jgi:hypothetical protein
MMLKTPICKTATVWSSIARTECIVKGTFLIELMGQLLTRTYMKKNKQRSV